ncbi:lysostaphin resistance A-like protein [Frigoribacterium sp. 2-23]|uniref:CPBP family intramembrane glutamic endopeptidase n=1 Tax=Frigoribacterium sp. 2-23 TaxID=3415006 RepID=UPI003C6F5F0E
MTTEYHRLFRVRPAYRWWKPLLAVAVAVALYVLLSLVFYAAVYAIVRAVGGLDAGQRLSSAVADDPLNAADPLVMLISLGSIAMLLPSVVVASRVVGYPSLTSVAGRLRWRWLARCLVPGLVFVAVSTVLSSVVVPALTGQPISFGEVTTSPTTLVWAIVVIVVLVPLQSSAEEFAFRGFAMQTLGAWLRWPVVAIVLPTVLFAVLHRYNVWGVLDVAVFGISAAYLTWRTGGLEAGIVAHVLNNTVVFVLLAPFSGVAASDGSPLGLAVTLISTPLYVWLVLRAARRSGVGRVLPSSSRGPAVHSDTATR